MIKRIFQFAGLVALMLMFATSVGAAPINQVPYASLTGAEVITFDDIVGSGGAGTNYNATFVSGGAGFGERFAGQTLGAAGDFDTLSGSPSAGLNTLAGAPNQNLDVLIFGGTNVMTGLGNLGYPNFGAVGEGSFAVVFSTDQSEFGFQLVGGNGGSATVDFFARDGRLIAEIVVNNLADDFYGFSRDGGIKDIAGITITNTDPAGIGFDNLKHDVKTDVGTAPEPATIGLLGLALLCMVYARRRSSGV
jgi:hypothetical protein